MGQMEKYITEERREHRGSVLNFFSVSSARSVVKKFFKDSKDRV